MFPQEQFTLTTQLSPDRACQKLLEVVEPPKPFRSLWDSSEKPYEGEIGEHSFRISRILHYRNSFAPIVTGRIQGDDRGSQIDIQMKMHPFVLFFLLFWLGMVGVGCLGAIAAIVSLQRFDPASLIPFGMFAFGCLLPFIGFKPEANRSKQFLIDLLSH